MKRGAASFFHIIISLAGPSFYVCQCVLVDKWLNHELSCGLGKALKGTAGSQADRSPGAKQKWGGGGTTTRTNSLQNCGNMYKS